MPLKPSCAIVLAAVLGMGGLTSAHALEAPVYEADDYPASGREAPMVSPAETPSAGHSVLRQGDSRAFEDTGQGTDSPLTLEQRLNRLEQKADRFSYSDMQARIRAFQADLQVLQGKLEQLDHRFQQLQASQQTIYTDLDRRLNSRVMPSVSDAVSVKGKTSPAASAKVSGGTASLRTTVSASAAVRQPNVAEEQQTYQQAYDLIKAEKYDQAVSTLQGMLRRYPAGQFAANAHYWLGELYGLQGKNTLSAAEFRTVLTRYPGSPRISDAALKIGLIYAAEQQWADAKKTFRDVINRYPGTSSARLASEQLKQIKQMGH